MSLVAHIAAGSLALIAGFVALFAAKGARLHRKMGMMFVYSMVALGVSGAGIAALNEGEASVIGGVLAAYLAITGLTTVRPPVAGSRWLHLALMGVALAVGAVSVSWGMQALATAKGSLDGIPAVIFFKFGTIALLAGVSDGRVAWFGAPQGARRLARHLWRMCFALYIASASFFLGQADELPAALRITPLLALLAFLPLLAMFYWLWRVRVRRNLRGLAGVVAHDARASGLPGERPVAARS
jgi:uncharacterized membrane protein